MQIIKKVRIRYFRSIYNVYVADCDDLNVFSGKNDVGKSNVLKALNLFFNGETDWKRPLDFYVDFSSKRLNEVRQESIKGKQFIAVEIEFIRPSTYKKSLPNSFTVTRTWHRDGGQPAQKDNLDQIHKSGGLASTLETTRRFLSLFLSRVHYEYVPAVKDRAYFTHMLSRLQATLLSTPLNDSNSIGRVAEDLAWHILEQITQLKSDFQRATGLETAINPPQQFADLFQSFIVSTTSPNGTIPITLRGDGVQARYVSSVLHYISSKSHDFFIWGFEEPENSLEYTRTNKLADDFVKLYSKDAQIFLTSHSPAFVSLETDRTRCFRAYQEENNTNIASIWPVDKKRVHRELLREELGILKIQQEVHKEYELKLHELTEINSKVVSLETEIVSIRKPLVLVEGKTDKALLEIAWTKLYGETQPNFFIRVADPTDGTAGGAAGAGTLAKMIETIHPEDSRKAIALFDRDTEGITEFNKLSKNFKQYNRKDDIKRHSNGIAYATTLPIPSSRNEYAEAQNLCIEFYFTDEVLAQKTATGEGLVLSEPLVRSLYLDGNKKIDLGNMPLFADVIAEQFSGALGCYRKVESGKVVFAEKIAPTLMREDFQEFELLFQRILELLADGNTTSGSSQAAAP